MKKLQILFIRHGEKILIEDDSSSGLTEESKARVKRIAAQLDDLQARPKYIFSSSYQHALETAQYLAPLKSDSGTQPIEIEALTPKSDEKHFGVENIISHLRRNNIALSPGETLALVGHESRLSQLVTLCTGQRLRPLDHLDVLCVTCEDTVELIRGTAEVSWRVPVKEYLEKDLRTKLSSKMTVATLLAGFTFTALLQVLMSPGFPKDVNFGSSLPLMYTVLIPYLTVITLSCSAALFIAAVYLYDSLGMPEGFWTEGERPKKRKHPAFVEANKDKHGLVYSYMIHAWTKLFTPALALGGVGLMLAISMTGSVPLIILCALSFVIVVTRYHRIKPRLGVD